VTGRWIKLNTVELPSPGHFDNTRIKIHGTNMKKMHNYFTNYIICEIIVHMLVIVQNKKFVIMY